MSALGRWRLLPAHMLMCSSAGNCCVLTHCASLASLLLPTPSRNGKQCRERWLNHLRTDIKKGGWTTAEELLLCQWHSILGPQWSKISKKLHGQPATGWWSEGCWERRANGLNLLVDQRS